jgi:hypothetical protein
MSLPGIGMLPNANTGSQGFRRGSLRRHMSPIKVADMTTGLADTGINVTLLLKNLSSDLNILIALGAVGTDQKPVRPNQYPANPGNLQLTPKLRLEEMPPLWMRPVFQDPTLASNQNHPLPQDIPFGWEGSTNSDEVEIGIVVPQGVWAAIAVTGSLILGVTLDYNGQWWDTQAVQYALSIPTLTTIAPGYIQTGGG